MTKEQIIKIINSLGDDVTYRDYRKVLYVTLEDFAGFDEDWNEIERDYNNPEAVDNFLTMLEKYGRRSNYGLFYEVYDFDDFNVMLGCASFNI